MELQGWTGLSTHFLEEESVKQTAVRYDLGVNEESQRQRNFSYDGI